MKGVLRKADIILGIVLIILCGILCWAVYGAESGGGTVVVVKAGGEIYGTYNINEDKEIIIENDGNYNKMAVKDGKILMIDADCPDKYCMGQYRSTGGMDRPNQTIVCLPNKVVISIEDDSREGSGDDSDDGRFESDAVSGTPVTGGAGTREAAGAGDMRQGRYQAEGFDAPDNIDSPDNLMLTAGRR